MEFEVTAPRSELARVLQRHIAATNAAPREAEGRALINTGLQSANTLLHDGHRWERLTPRQIVTDTRDMLARSGRFSVIVHASYAFLRGAEERQRVGDRLQPIVEAAQEAEQLVLDDRRPSCVVRIGYRYGPESRDLRLYRRAFRMGRPYWAGPPRTAHHHIHNDDAAAALLAAAARPAVGRIVYATDMTPAPFASLMDHFARRVGNPLPLHIPRFLRLPAHLVVAEAHMQMCELGIRGRATPGLAGFTPKYASFRTGVDAVIDAWRSPTGSR